ncbi:MAG: CpaF family protein [Eggerthellaceae bacterium]|nr:CpaF family protein [Eggerthellaceae bacterium]
MTLQDRINSAQVVLSSENSEDAHVLEQLKSEVSVMLVADKLARMVVENPTQAKNEIRRASKQIFSSGQWLSRDASSNERLLQALIDSVFGLGPLQSLVEDNEITEIMVNGPYSIFVERNGRIEKTAVHFPDAAHMRALIDKILAPLGRRVDEHSPMVDARLSSGHRVHIVIAPVALDGPVITIRKFSQQSILLSDMVASNSITPEIEEFLTICVKRRKSIAVIGGTGSGKTTLLNALSCVIPYEERIITIEDSAELRFDSHPHVVRLEARNANNEGVGEITIRDLVRASLRMRPSRIIVGECRGAEALDMLQAMNTGHEGSLTTLHANSTKDMVMRLVAMVRFGTDLPVDVIEGIIASALDVVVQVSRDKNGKRYVSEIAAAHFDEESRHCIVVPLMTRKDSEHSPQWSGKQLALFNHESSMKSNLAVEGEAL